MIEPGTCVIGYGVHVEKNGMGSACQSTHSAGYRPPKFAQWGSNGPKTVLSGANGHHNEGLVGGTWLPMGLHLLPVTK